MGFFYVSNSGATKKIIHHRAHGGAALHGEKQIKNKEYSF